MVRLWILLDHDLEQKFTRGAAIAMAYMESSKQEKYFMYELDIEGRNSKTYTLIFVCSDEYVIKKTAFNIEQLPLYSFKEDLRTYLYDNVMQIWMNTLGYTSGEFLRVPMTHYHDNTLVDVEINPARINEMILLDKLEGNDETSI